MKKNILTMVSISILIAGLLSGCINKESQEEYIRGWKKNSETMMKLGEETAWNATNEWCYLNCHFEKEENSGRYWLEGRSGGDGNVTVSFMFDDRNATVYGEEYMKPCVIGNSTWRIYAISGSIFKWVFHIFSNLSENITMTIVKDLEPFPFCPECKFKPIVKELVFNAREGYGGFL